MSVSSQDLATSEEPPADPAPPQVRGTPIRAIDLPGLHDYWAIYERHFEEIGTIVLVELSDDPELGPLIRNTPREVLDERGARSRELTRKAILEGQWQPYIDNLREQGAMYAHTGLSFSAWFRVISAFRPHVVRHLLAAFAADTQRMVQAIDGMDHLIDLAMSVIGEVYLATKEDVIARQREAIGELRSRARYQAILASIADGVITTDPFGNVVTLNPAMERLSGRSAEEAVGTRYEETFPLLDGDRTVPWEERHLARAIASRRTVTSEGEDVRLVRADGTSVPVSITSAPVIEEGGKLTGGVNVIRERPTR